MHVPHHPDRLAAPLDDLDFAFLDIANVDFDRRARCLGFFGRLKGKGEGQGGTQAANAADKRSGDNRAAPAAVHGFFDGMLVTHVSLGLEKLDTKTEG